MNRQSKLVSALTAASIIIGTPIAASFAKSQPSSEKNPPSASSAEGITPYHIVQGAKLLTGLYGFVSFGRWVCQMKLDSEQGKRPTTKAAPTPQSPAP